MDGCNLNPDQILVDQSVHFYIDAIATYDDHRRIILLPRRFNWKDVEEAVWDALLDDDYLGNTNRYNFLRNHFDSVGIACNCNPVYGQVCIAELGKNVVPILPLEFNNLSSNPEDIDFWDISASPTDCYPDMPDYYYCIWMSNDFNGTRWLNENGF